MEFTVGWLDPDTGKMKEEGSLSLEARDVYHAKVEFLKTQLGGTKYANFLVAEWLPLVRSRGAEDNRKRARPPEDFLISLSAGGK